MSTPDHIRLKIPSWAAILYISLTVITIPWTVYLDQTLPPRHTFQHWDVAWVGLDVLLCVMLFLTGLLAHRKSKWVVLTAVSTATCLVIDAWFDVISARSGRSLLVAATLAIVIELPLAALSFMLAYKALKNGLHE